MNALAENRLSLDCETRYHGECPGTYQVGTSNVSCHCSCHKPFTPATPGVATAGVSPSYASAPGASSPDPRRDDDDSRAECSDPASEPRVEYAARGVEGLALSILDGHGSAVEGETGASPAETEHAAAAGASAARRVDHASSTAPASLHDDESGSRPPASLDAHQRERSAGTPSTARQSAAEAAGRAPDPQRALLFYRGQCFRTAQGRVGALETVNFSTRRTFFALRFADGDLPLTVTYFEGEVEEVLGA